MEAAGLAFGLLPVGLKAYREIEAFITSTKNADAETASLLRQLKHGRELLDTLAEVTNSGNPIPHHVEDVIKRASRDVQNELDSARKVVAKIRGASDLSTKENDENVGPIRKTKKFTYYWRRDHVKELKQHLSYCDLSLSNILHTYRIFDAKITHAETMHLLLDIKSQIQGLKETQITSHNVVACEQRPTSLPTIPQSTTLQSQSGGIVPQLQDTTHVNGCYCRRKRRVIRSSTGTRWFLLDREKTTTTTHEVGCLYHGLGKLGTEQLYTLTISSRSFWTRLTTAVAISINIPAARFNQWAISPQMRTFNMVDLDKSPAIRLCGLADDLEDLEWDDPAMEKKARLYWHRHIIKVFQTGKASPFDVDYDSHRPILHFLRFDARRNTTPYVRLMWETLHNLDFPEHMMVCNGLKPWAWFFSKSTPLSGKKLDPELLPQNIQPWLEPEEIPDVLLEGIASADDKLGRAFVLVIIMNQKRSLLEDSNIGLLCQAIIMRSSSKVIELLDDNICSWDEPFLGDECSICAIDLAIMWFPELMNTLLQETASSNPRLRLPRPHPSKHSFLEVAINFGVRHGERLGMANLQDYLAMVHLALERDHPVFFHRIALHLDVAKDTVMLHLADRRRRLLELARKRLLRSHESCPEIFEKLFVDEKVEEVLQAFADEGINVPEALQPRCLGSPATLAGSIFEYAWHSEDLCDSLEDLGFDPEGFVRSRCRSGPFPMSPLLSPVTWNSWRFLWLLNVVQSSETGIGNTIIQRDPKFVHNLERTCSQESQMETTGPSFLHALMAYLGYCVHLKRASGFVFPRVTKPQLQSELVDSCSCACSISGCRPLTVFVKPVLVDYLRQTSLDLNLERVTHVLKVVEVIFNDRDELMAQVIDILRICTFECLGCRHTCCKEPMAAYVYGYSTHWPSEEHDVEERVEIHEEDSEKLQILEEIMIQMQSDMSETDWDVTEFVTSRWMPVIRKVFSEQRERQLSAMEVQKIRDIGVTWDIPLKPLQTQRIEHDRNEATDSPISVNLDRAETDEQRLADVMELVDRICR